MDIHGKVKITQNIDGEMSSTYAVTGEIDGGIKEKIHKDNVYGKVKTTQDIGGNVSSTSAITGEINSNVGGKNGDYNLLINKPSIEGVKLIGNKKITDFGIPYVFYNTVANWDSDPTKITIKNAVYVYTDYRQDELGNNVPGIKIGDGLGYLIDSPFIDGDYYEHIKNKVIHVTAEDKQRWNDKVRCYIDIDDTEKLVFTTQ